MYRPSATTSNCMTAAAQTNTTLRAATEAYHGRGGNGERDGWSRARWSRIVRRVPVMILNVARAKEGSDRGRARSPQVIALFPLELSGRLPRRRQSSPSASGRRDDSQPAQG